METVKEEAEVVVKDGDTKGEDTARAERSAKAVKSNDAEIPIYLWDEQILLGVDTTEVLEEEVKEALTMLRRLMLHYWKNKVHQDFFKWFEAQS
jgi:hypothetical protein